MSARKTGRPATVRALIDAPPASDSEAADVARRVLGAANDFAEVEELARGAIARGQGKLAALAVARAHELAPDYRSVAQVQGALCADAALREAAIAGLQEAGYAADTSGCAAFVMAELLRADGLLARARDHYGRAAQGDSALAGRARCQRAIMQTMLGEYHAAESYLREELAAHGDSVDVLNNLGVVLVYQGRLKEAEAQLRAALALDGQARDVHQNLFWVLMLMGRLSEAWAEDDWREVVADEGVVNCGIPWWTGAELPPGRLLVVAEQGIGDEIMYASCFDELMDSGVALVVQCHAKLGPLFERSFPRAAVLASRDVREMQWNDGQQPAHMVLAGTLPHFLRRTPAAFPARPAWLRADANRIGYWRERLAALGDGPFVGITWRGGSRPREMQQRSIPLSDWASLLRAPGRVFVGLQYGEHGEEIAAARAQSGIDLRVFDDLDAFNNLDDLAALICALDLIISVDNATVHLAGALGRPVWTLLPAVPDWRWLMGRETSPWYPTMRLFRQPAPGDWASVMSMVAAELTVGVPAPAAPTAVASGGASAVLLDQGAERLQAGDVAGAERLVREALAREPRAARGWQLLGRIALRCGHPGPAAEHFQRAIDLQPRNAEFLADLAGAHEADGHPAEAVVVLERALALAPRETSWHGRLGDTLRLAGRPADAVNAYRRALECGARERGVRNNLGVTLYELRRFDEAITCYESILADLPDDAEVWSNLGLALQSGGREDEARRAFERALELQPDNAATLYNIGILYHDQGNVDRAVDLYRQALVLKPDFSQALNNLGNALTNHGDVTQSFECYRRAAQLPGGSERALQNFLFSLNYSTVHTAQQVAAEHAAWGRMVEQAERLVATPRRDLDPERPLRVGIVSPDLRSHSVAYFLHSVFAHLDRERFSIWVYNCSGESDRMTATLRACASHWRDVILYSDFQLARTIVGDGIDILIECAGHTRGNRLRMMARRPAPVQVTYVGYPNTTGLSRVDYRLVDAVSDPQGSEGLCTERLWRLPGCHLCYQAPPVAPEPGAGSRRDHAVYGSFNDVAKINDQVLAAWARILEATPGARLVLKSKYLAGEGTQARLRARAQAAGIDGERLELRAWSRGVGEHLAQYDGIDVALDPFPYNGVTTTFEALLMGVPVVALTGDRHAGRMGASILGALGRPDLVCADVDAYVECAAALGAAGARPAADRRELRACLLASSLTDAPAFAERFGEALRGMWREYINGGVRPL